jgi:hypothetical protein
MSSLTLTRAGREPGLRPLHTAGPDIVDDTGQVVTLRGTNLGGWLLQECWMSPAGDALVACHDQITATAFATEPGYPPQAMLDHNPATCWTSGQPQASGQCVTLDLGAMRTFNQIAVDAGVRGADSPQGLVIHTSPDAHSWTEAGWVGGDHGLHVLRLPHLTTRFVRIMLTHARPDRWWSIAEVRLTVSDEFHTRHRLTQRFGKAGAERLLNTYRDAWIQAADLTRLSDIGFNCLRLPIDWQILMDRHGRLRPEAEAFGRIDWLLDQAEAAGLYVILDLHGLPGGANPWHSSGIAGQNAFWRDDRCQVRAETVWRALARRYRGRSVVAGYDLINEPLVTMGEPETPEDVAHKFAVTDRLLRAVRAEDPDHIVMIAVFPDWEHALPPWQFGWTNVVYQTHHYSFWAQEHHDGMKAFVQHELHRLQDYRQRWGMPVYAGEFWFGAFPDLYDDWLGTLNQLGISWTSWTYKVKNRPDARGPDGILHGVSWSLYYDAPFPAPDLDRDSAVTIAEKWSHFSTDHFQPNAVMHDIYRRHAAPRKGARP